MHSLRIAFVIVSISVFFLVRKDLGTWLVSEDEIVKADIIIVLMGSIDDRVLQVADIYNLGYASKVLLVETRSEEKQELLNSRGVHVESNTQQSKNALVNMGIPSDSIYVLPGGATSTLMEALIVREYIRPKSEWDTILLVTSADHTRRASMIFDYVIAELEQEIHIASIPSNYTSFYPDLWWKDKENIQAVLEEYLKIVNFRCFERRKIRHESNIY